MFSVITKRAFVLRNLDNDFKLEDGYDRPNIDWTFQVNETGRSVHRVMDFGTSGEEPRSTAVPIFRNGNLHDIGDNADLVLFERCNFGTVIQLAHNRYHKSEIFAMVKYFTSCQIVF
ncbi:hypothetical protein WJX75_000047 [Coccomyxa subellipsoidea]|uniref:Uncharacterized protein n=1 Tax=Coccomyxa subellipsoidea TaxID=248742 RepID=A0ABR2Z1W4_9CHLO